MKRINTWLAACGILFLLGRAATDVFAQEGYYWLRIAVKDTMTNIEKLIKNTYPSFNPAHHRFTGQSGDRGQSFEYVYYSTIDRKNHTYRGHVAWQWTNPASMVPGQKLTVRGIVSNLSPENSCVSAYMRLGSFSFMKPETGKPYCASANGSTTMAGTVEIPKPGLDRNGKVIPYLYLTMILSGGNEFRWVERTITFQWTPKKPSPPPPPPGVGSVAGKYKTNFNEMTLSVSGNTVTGTYNWNNGKIEGTLNGKVLTGRWYQSNGTGRFVFVFNNDFTAFTGKWGYNEAEPASAWNGTRIN